MYQATKYLLSLVIVMETLAVVSVVYFGTAQLTNGMVAVGLCTIASLIMIYQASKDYSERERS